MEDVRHLLDAAKEESYLFLVDSRTRDTAVFPSPSEYEITFASPFRNVFGMDLMDASIARTEYIVDATENVVEYALGQPASLEEWAQGGWAHARKRTATLQPGDYNLPQFVEHLNARLKAAADARGEPALVCAPTTNPAEISNKVRLTCSQPFVLLAATSTVRHVLGFGDPVTGSGAAEYACVPGWSVNRTGGASDAFLSRPSDLPDAEPLLATMGPLPVAADTSFAELYGSRVARQHFHSAVTGPPTRALVYMLAAGTAPPQLSVRVCRSDGTAVATGTAQAVAGDPDSAYVSVECALTATGALTVGEAAYIEFAAVGQGGTAQAYVGVYYNQDNLPSSDARYLTVDGQAVVGVNACVDVLVAATGHAVVCPGVVNLTGPRYVSIRCPEIESHMFRDRVNERCHAGLGMVSLRGYGFREQRYDFVSFPPRRFHPLGKLSKLTFRLERPDGTLYDSHGVDHTMLLVLRYYRAVDATPTAPSQLNPHYTPDLRRHLVETKWAAEARATDMTNKMYGK